MAGALEASERSRGSSVPRRQLGRWLRQHRENSGLTRTEVAAKLDRIAQTTLWRWETGQVGVRPIYVRELGRIYGLDEERTRALMALAEETRAPRGWWVDYLDVIPEWLDLYLGFEAAAIALDGYAVEIVPGLLQTERYARTLIEAHGYPPADVDRRVRVRMERQTMLSRSVRSPELRFVLSEGVLRQGDPRLIAEQTEALLVADSRPNVHVRVSTFTRGLAHLIPCGGFVHLRFPANGEGPAEPDTVYVDGYTGGLFLDKPAEIAEYDRAFSRLWDATISISEFAEMGKEEQ